MLACQCAERRWVSYTSTMTKRRLTDQQTRRIQAQRSSGGDGAAETGQPGVRDFGLTHVAPETVFNGFREFSPYLGQCRFRDCQHQSEPGCALIAAVESGEISSERFESFQQIVATLATA